MSLSNNEISTLKNQINSVLNSDDLQELAFETGFIQRRSNRITPLDFVFLMTIDLVCNPLAPLVELCRRLFELNPLSKLTPQSLSERINSKKCVSFFKAVFSKVLELNRDKLVCSVDASLLSSFNRVLLEDSTQIQLHPKLAEEFAGSGGSASESAIKLDLIEDIKHAKIEHIELYEGKKPDQSLSDHILDLLKPNDLVLRDLGYFVVEIFAKIIKKKAFFLSRLLLSVTLYSQSSESAESLNLSTVLNQKKYRHLNGIELDVYMGNKHKVPTRLIAYRLPDSIVNERKRNAKALAKKKDIS